MEVKAYEEAWNGFLDAYKLLKDVNLEFLELLCDMADELQHHVDDKNDAVEELLTRYKKLVGIEDGASISN